MKRNFIPIVRKFTKIASVLALAAIVSVASLYIFVYTTKENVNIHFYLTDSQDPQNEVQLQLQEDLTFTPGISTSLNLVKVDGSKQFQSMQGFGAALTDSSAWLLKEVLNASLYEEVMKMLFDPIEGIGMSYIRIPVGSSDCALEFYSYDDTAPDLDDFSIVHDEHYIIPLLKDALKLNPSLKLVASPWSAPGWMKLGNNATDPETKGLIGGNLAPKMHEVYANYLVKFLRSYAEHNITINALTIQNEQFYSPPEYPGMTMNVSQTQEFGVILASAISNADLDTDLYILDHNWGQYEKALEILSDKDLRESVKGVAWHGYGETKPDWQSVVRKQYPSESHIFTEISPLSAYTSFPHNLEWTYHNIYVGSIRNWAEAVLLWNLALDQNGGPILTNSTELRGVLTVPRSGNQQTEPVQYHGEYYMIGHLSKFVEAGAVRIASSKNVNDLETIAFKNPDGSKVLVVSNPTEESKSFGISWDFRSVQTSIGARSLATYIWP